MTDAGDRVTSTEATGTGVTVTETVAPLPSLVAEMVAVPAATAVTSPTDETVATFALSDAHTTSLPESGLPCASLSVARTAEVRPTIRERVAGESVIAATGAGGTGDTVSSALPVFPSLVATICAVPAASVVTSPSAETVATEELSELQVTGRSRVPCAVSKIEAFACTVAPAITEVDTSVTSTDATGMGVTVIIAVALLPSLEAVIVAVPTEIADTRPVEDTVAIAAASVLQITSRSVNTL
jgi:hypothetical protein